MNHGIILLFSLSHPKDPQPSPQVLILSLSSADHKETEQCKINRHQPAKSFSIDTKANRYACMFFLTFDLSV